MTPKNYRQGLASAKAGKGIFGSIPVAQRTEYYHRQILLARLFAADSAPWVLKGGAALVWRDPAARSTRDIDMFNESAVDIGAAVDQLTAHLNEISTPPLDVQFECEVKSYDSEISLGGRQNAVLSAHLLSTSGRRIPNPIKIDLVVGCAVTGSVETQHSVGLEEVLGADFPEARLYPITDHLADKVAATMSTYPQLSGGLSSTRVRDLVDIVQIALTEVVDGSQLWVAIESERQIRGLAPYRDGFVCPSNWEALYVSKKLGKGRAPADFWEALTLAQTFLNPAVSGESKGKIWQAGRWV